VADAELSRERLQLAEIGLTQRLVDSGQQQADIVTGFGQLGAESQRHIVALQSGAATRQQQQAATGQHRKLRVQPVAPGRGRRHRGEDRKSTRLNSSHVKISYAVFCLKKTTKNRT